ncbi:MAG: hypothetical protein M3041_17330 [Acidobacteriota bacterium]|nr:hypothetical protein [Acidobacteriota bacterium]
MFSTRKADLAAIAVLLAIITAIFSDVIFFGSNFYVRDVALQYYPIRRVLHDLIASGHFPFWNPLVSAGQPLAANPAYEAFYPFQWSIFIPNFDLGFRLAILLHFYLAATGVYLLLRSLRTRIAAALFGAITFTLGGTFLSLTNLLPFLFSAAWLPWIGLFWRRALDNRRISDFAATALTLGLLLLAADQSMILQAGGLIVAYGVYRNRRFTLAMPAVLVAAFLIGAVQLVPALDLQSDSARSLPIPYATAASWSFAPYRPLELLFPNLDSWYSSDLTLIWSRRFHLEFPSPLVFSHYPGLLAGVLILAGIACRIRGWKFVAGWSLLSYVLAIFPALYTLGIRSIRYPEKFFVSGVFVMIVFAALAFDEIDRNAKLRRASLILLGCIAAISATLFVYAHSSSYAQLFAAIWHESNALFITASRRGWMIAAAKSAALFAILFLHRRFGNRILGLLAAFVLIDLGSRINGLAPRIEAGYYDPPASAEILAAERRPIRIYNDADHARRQARLPEVPLQARLWAIRNGMIPRMEEIWGFGGIFEEDLDLTTLLPTREMTQMFQALAKARPDRVPLLLMHAGVTHVGLLQVPIIRSMNTEEEIHQYSYVRFEPFPGNDRYWFADQIIPARTADDVSRSLGSPMAISRRAAFADIAPFRPAFGRIMSMTSTPNAIDLDVEAEGQALLVIGVTRHKYWKGIMDGMPSPPLPANVAFQSFVVPKGRHHIALRYRNPPAMIFGVVSIVTFLALLTAACVSRSRALPPPSQR